MQQEPTRETSALAGDPVHVLVVDDDVANLRAVTTLLQRSGYLVASVDRGRAALAMLERNPMGFDILLTDFQMPDLDGIELAVRAHALCPALSVVMMSGDPEQMVAETAGRLSVPLLTKPFGAGELMGALQAL